MAIIHLQHRLVLPLLEPVSVVEYSNTAISFERMPVYNLRETERLSARITRISFFLLLVFGVFLTPISRGFFTTDKGIFRYIRALYICQFSLTLLKSIS